MINDFEINSDKKNDSFEEEKEASRIKSALIGRKPEHYIPIFERLDKGGVSVSALVIVILIEMLLTVGLYAM